MAAIVFPTSPTTGQVFGMGESSWQWDGTVWRTVRDATQFYNLAFQKIECGSATDNDALFLNGEFTLRDIVSPDQPNIFTAQNTFNAATTFIAANAIRSQAAATQDAVIIAGRAGGTSSYAATITPTTLTANRTVTIPDESFDIGFRNVPSSGATKTAAYTLVSSDSGKVITLGTGGSIDIPNSVFSAGDVVTVFNNTSSTTTIATTISTAYIAGVDGNQGTITLGVRGLATILFTGATSCVVSGNVS